MRTYTTEHTVYQFDELSEDAQAKALENLYDINVSDPYWYYDEYLEDIASKYGIALKWSDLCFELDRNTWLYLDNHDHGRKGDASHLDDPRKFLKMAGIDLRSKDARSMIDNGISLDCTHYGGGDGRNTINADGADVSGESEDRLQATIDELSDKLRTALREQYDALTAEDQIKDTIYANEYEFTADGELA